MSNSKAAVLVVDDEVALADLYSAWLAEVYDVRTAYDAAGALEQLDTGVDCVLLDRRMPDMSGDDVLTEIEKRGLDCAVAMVTAVEPDFDVLAMGFDDYVVKPVDRSELLSLVEDVLTLDSYDDLVQRYYQLVSKKVAIEAAKSDDELAESAEYEQLLADYQEAKDAADTSLDELFSSERRTTVF